MNIMKRLIVAAVLIVASFKADVLAQPTECYLACGRGCEGFCQAAWNQSCQYFITGGAGGCQFCNFGCQGS